ncbi:nucleotidyltransferase [Marinifilum sp. N1E240]|uniref:SMODS domain-containing nucleotidyltransferase n=1 Tax=Marinifilum sp. N1E240 TaxID=2608082 RepID=UPI00128B65D7|nr:nucleotidyltransferase [Marinifilum sp. N1E240]MPQ49276.1 nucleotidyltransferase [Marinifilum sp. N1E240]
MATTVNSAFDEFNKDIVNLLKDRTDKARTSREWLLTQLNGLDSKEDLDFPFKYDSMHINFGSFQRRTKIRELDDIDLMFCFTANGASYTLYPNNIYHINTPNAGQRLKNLSDSDVLNSRRVVNKVKNSLSQISQYKSAELHSRGEAATLSLSSYEWVFDIVPCFYTDTGLYLIPDGNGNWKPTDPRIDQDRVTTANQNKDGRLLQLIRILKYWNRRNSSYTIGSYLFENIVINFANAKSELSKWIDYDIRSFFLYLKSAIWNSVNDPKGFQGDLNGFSFSEKQSISQKADWAYQKADEAIKAEVDDKDVEKSINKWREIFGDDFPKYE